MIERVFWCALIVGGFLAVTAATGLALEQPNGTPIPGGPGCDSGQPTGLAAEFACECEGGGGCNIGPVCPSPGNCVVPAGNCETTLSHEFNDNTCIPSQLTGLNPQSDGSLEPQTFTPTCPLTFNVVSRGTAQFRDVFGWYNVTGERPELTELHVMLDCNAQEGDDVVLDVRGDPAWAGGEVGFFIATPQASKDSDQCAGGDCCATIDRVSAGQGFVYFSERQFNPDADGADSFVHLIVYDSRITERKFYFAWEDIYGGSNTDFTDVVTSVSGVECSAGGQSCDTGEMGICGEGITTCGSADVACVQLRQPTTEVCDGADNDCDGEFDEGVCTDDVVAGCAGVECPAGRICRQGNCVDPCAHVECGDGETCRGGACFPGCNQCNGVVCYETETCNIDNGHCSGGDIDEPDDVDAGTDELCTGENCSGGGGGGGCGCRASGNPGSAAVWLVLVCLALGRARRMSHRRPQRR